MTNRIRFVVAGAVCMANLSTAVVFEDFADRLNVGISQISAGQNVTGTFIDEDSYRKFDRNHPVGTLFSEYERPEGLQVTAAVINLCSSSGTRIRPVMHLMSQRRGV